MLSPEYESERRIKDTFNMFHQSYGLAASQGTDPVMTNMTKIRDEIQSAATEKPARRALWAAYGACGWAFLFAALSFYWALGGMAGADTLSPAIAQLARERAPWMIALLWITGLLKAFGGFVALALVQSWGRKVPRWLLLLLAWGAGTLLFLHGGLFFVVGALATSGFIHVATPAVVLYWYTILWGPYWLLGGALFLIAAWNYLVRAPRQRADLLFSALGVFGALALLVLSGGTIG